MTFRLSAEEYIVLERWCKMSGARSISDFARVAILDKVQLLGAPRLTLASDLTTLGKALGDLDKALCETHKKIQGLLGTADATGAG